MNPFNDCNTVPRKKGAYEISGESQHITWAYWDGSAWREETTDKKTAFRQPVAANQKKAWR